ncbi:MULTISPECIES: hypothetical protein [unclassified Saccharibacter]|uniref:hypothetical protein n=1 Tax=unclassified Saccharibacter TaxID=2648722 RepID=UPI0013234008|nr:MULTISPECIES: hypothetical protein [unclassified Saccharibacter]MXV35197.1 hypothetical protein [Saccharibacter sp. EH611]MXV57256.1 hypothetical protein [Saccharibacter sp. EH70]MXV64883.1 hypothetical protein [Saccharibacter sp. EH60]
MMRPAHRTLAEHRPIRRNNNEKRRQLNELCNTALRLRPQTTPALRASIERRIRELRSDLRQKPTSPSSPQERPHRSYVLHAD